MVVDSRLHRKVGIWKWIGERRLFAVAISTTEIECKASKRYERAIELDAFYSFGWTIEILENRGSHGLHFGLHVFPLLTIECHITHADDDLKDSPFSPSSIESRVSDFTGLKVCDESANAAAR